MPARRSHEAFVHGFFRDEWLCSHSIESNGRTGENVRIRFRSCLQHQKDSRIDSTISPEFASKITLHLSSARSTIAAILDLVCR
jgi:hypothetical protein